MNKLYALLIVVVLGGGMYIWSRSSMQVERAVVDVKEEMMPNTGPQMETGVGVMDSTKTMDKDAMMESNQMMSDEATMKKKGTYEAYSAEKLAFAKNGKVVLFFRASWCPTCKALDADIKAHQEVIPSSVVILDVDYDNSAELKKKYGVTYQHTLVQVDASGKMIAKWAGSPTLSDLVVKIK